MMADLNFTRSIISLCRQSLSGDKMAIKAAEDQMSLLVKTDAADTELKLALIFKIILAPQAISAAENSLSGRPHLPSDDELCGLKYASMDVQLWASIFLKNYIRSNFDNSESFGGVSDAVRNIVKSFLVIATLNSDRIGLPKPVASQLESALLMIAERDFPESLEHVLLLIDYCHLSDINHRQLVETLSARLQNELNARQNLNVLSPHVDATNSLGRSLAEAQSTAHLSYAEYLLNHVKNYVGLAQTIGSYSKILATNNPVDSSRAYFEFFNSLLEGVKNMCNIAKGLTLKDLEMNKFTQAAAFLLCQSTLNTHTANPLTQTYEVTCSPADALFYFDDRNLYTDPKLFAYGNVPELGAHQHNAHLMLSQQLYVSELCFNKNYYKTKLNSFELFAKLMRKYKSRAYDNDTLAELKVVLTLTDVHLLYLFKYSMLKFREYYALYSAQRNTFALGCLVPAILDLLEIVRQVTKIFCYVHSIDLPESFEDNAQLYFSGLIKLIHFNDQFVLEQDSKGASRSRSGTANRMKIAAMKLFRYYAERYQEVFHPFVFTCIEDVVQVCRGLGQDAAFDRLCCAALDFLAAASATHWRSSQPASARSNPFMNNAFLAEIIQTIIVPNIGFRECDLFLLDDCPIEFVQREVDANNCATRRFSSISFLKKLVASHGQVCQQIISQVAKSVAASNDYKLKELYLQLIICINFKVGSAHAQDASGDFNVNSYFNEYLKAEFVLLSQSQLPQQKMLIILAIIKYLYTFRALFPDVELVALVPHLFMYIKNAHEAVRSFACEAVARLLPQLRLHAKKLKPCLLQVGRAHAQGLEHLLTMMNSTKTHNEFYAKCTMKIFLCLREDLRESGMLMVDILIALIKAVSDNPVNPVYNHYLFECLSILIRINLQTQFYAVAVQDKLEEALIPTLGLIIQQEMHPFIPYSLQVGPAHAQVFSLMLKFATKASNTYVQLLNHLVCIDTWKVSNVGAAHPQANAQGNIKLLVCFFEKHALFESELVTSMEKILNIFHFCLVHRKLSRHSLELLNGIIRFLPLNYYVNFLKSIVTVLLTYIHKNKGADALRDVVASISLLTLYLHLHKYAHSLVDILESIQVGIAVNFIRFAYLENAKRAASVEAKKVHAAAIAKVATSAQVQGNLELFRTMLEFLGDLISGENMTLDTPKEDEFDPNKLDVATEDLNFDVSYAKLQSADDRRSKLLDRSINVEEVIKDVLAPVSGLIKASLPLTPNANALLALIA